MWSRIYTTNNYWIGLKKLINIATKIFKSEPIKHKSYNIFDKINITPCIQIYKFKLNILLTMVFFLKIETK